MAKTIDPAELAMLPLEDEMQYGKKHILDLYSNKNRNGFVQRTIWHDLFESMALSTIKWNGLDALGIDSRAVEYTLLHFGAGGIFRDNGGFLFAAASFRDMYNIYWNPNLTLLTAPTGDQWTRHCDAYAVDIGGNPAVLDPDCVVCWDNMTRRPLLRSISHYADRISKYDTVGDVNVEAQLTPWIVAAPPEQKRQARRWQTELENRKQYIPINEGASLPYTLDTKAPWVAENVKLVQRQLINELLTILGIDNTPVDKKERVQTAEVLSNNEMVMAARESRLKPRREFCDKVNTVFKLPPEKRISVEWGIEGVYADIAAATAGGGLGAVAFPGGEE